MSKRQVAAARELLDRPFAPAHEASIARQLAQPKGYEALLRWFLEGFRAEVPDALHERGVFVGRPPRHGEGLASIDPTTGSVASSAADLTGGSLIGSPRVADSFRSLLEDSPFATEVAEYEGHRSPFGHYRRPMRAALAELAGRGADEEPYPFMARTLYRTAVMDGDWDAACASMGIIEPVRQVYVSEALYRLWRRYRIEPPARPVAARIAREVSAA